MEFKIFFKGNMVDDEDNQFEDYFGKYRIFIYLGEELEIVMLEMIMFLVDRLLDIKENNVKINLF